MKRKHGGKPLILKVLEKQLCFKIVCVDSVPWLCFENSYQNEKEIVSPKQDEKKAQGF